MDYGQACRQTFSYRITEGLPVIRAESGTMKGSPGLETKYSSIAPGLPRRKSTIH